MKPYRILDLPGTPCEDPGVLTVHQQRVGSYHRYPPTVLRADISRCLRELGLLPEYVIVFTWRRPGGIPEKIIHTDIRYEQGRWRPIRFSINWELEGSGVFQWFDIPTDHGRHYPGEEDQTDADRRWLNGVHFGKRGNRGLPLGARLCAEQNTDRPMLVRTELAHTVISDAPRRALSVRFQDISYEEAYQRLEPIAVQGGLQD